MRATLLAAGRGRNGQGNIHLLSISEAINQRSRKKYGTDAYLAAGTVDGNEPKKYQKQVAGAFENT